MHNELLIELNKNKKYRDKLFCRGFLFTDNAEIDDLEYPFYGLWNRQRFNNYLLFVHPNTNYYYFENNNKVTVLIGHTYNPFTGEYQEDVILKNLANHNDEDSFFSYFNQLTGNFTYIEISDLGVKLITDPTGMQMAYYGYTRQKLYISSHSQLIGYLADLMLDEYVIQLIYYKFYPLFGTQLPGDLSPYKEIKRMVPNHMANMNDGQITISRFWPRTKIKVSSENLEEVSLDCAKILKNSMNIIAKKWEKPAISMTGGCDSKTTLSSAVDSYSEFECFSYVSSDEEKVDADLAKEICDSLGLKHKTYTIPNKNEYYEDFDLVKKILYINSGCIGKNNDNDIRKRIFFDGVNDFDVEVKSWASEIGRAYYGKRFEKNTFPKKLTSKYCRTLYKVFVSNFKLIRRTDQIFKEYLAKYDVNSCCGEWQDLFFWEFRMSAWNGLVITGEHRYSFEITIPYNNRILLGKMISVPAKDKKSDMIHKKIREINNPMLSKFEKDLVNVKHTKNRAKLERIYLEIFSRL